MEASEEVPNENKKRPVGICGEYGGYIDFLFIEEEVSVDTEEPPKKKKKKGRKKTRAQFRQKFVVPGSKDFYGPKPPEEQARWFQELYKLTLPDMVVKPTEEYEYTPDMFLWVDGPEFQDRWKSLQLKNYLHKVIGEPKWREDLQTFDGEHGVPKMLAIGATHLHCIEVFRYILSFMRN